MIAQARAAIASLCLFKKSIQKDTETMKNWMLTLSFSFAFALLTGCGETAPGKDEGTLVEAVVRSVNDAAGSDEMFREIFVGGTAPAEREKYFSSIIQVVGTPEISGNEAKVNVEISQGAAAEEGRGAKKSEEIAEGQVTWTLQKQGEVWKLKDAPMP